MIITAGKYKGQKITAPDENITRPTLSKVRMGVFNSLQSIIDFEGSSFLDMFAGSGIMGLEALSRGFDKVYSIEKNKKSAYIIKSNFSKFEKSPKLFIGDSFDVMKKISQTFDVIYIDPPYFSGIYEKCLCETKKLSPKIVILEHVTNINFEGYEVLKQKKYGDKYITFLRIL